uniref:Geissoschizine oxidase n=1 Tax=Strychnos sp. TaxID=2946199 RepID=GO_STRYX|nr:geissoschizine oxidase [Strychnos sp.]
MQMEFSFSSPSFFFLLPFLFLLIKPLISRKSSLKLPPGPKKFPIVGNLFQMEGLLPHLALKKMTDKYGPICHLKLGELEAVVVSSAELAKEVLNTHAVTFADRPVTNVSKIVMYNNSGMTFARYGDYFKLLRQIYASELLSPKRVRSSSNHMEDELSKFVVKIQAETGKPIFLHDRVKSYLFAVLFDSMIGGVCKCPERYIEAAKELSANSAAMRLEDFFPSVTLLPKLSGFNTVLAKLKKEIDDLLDDLISEREKRPANATGPMEEHMLDVLLKLRNGSGSEAKIPITNEDIKAVVFELMLANLSTAATEEWAMSEMMRNPKVFKKAQDEVRRAFKGKNRICASELHKLEYLKLVIKEALRMHPPAPLLFPRKAREDCEIGGYTIPAGTMVWVNYWAVGRDPQLWHDADKFEPERFSDTSIDFNGSHSELIPFGAGRRICPGILYSATNLELLLSALLYHFDWELPSGEKPEEIDMDEFYGSGCIRKNPLALVPKVVIPCQA